MEGDITIPVKIDAPVFRRFAVFDTLCRQKRWRSPALFAVIMAVFACVCLSMQGRQRGALLLGVVLLIIGLGLPAAYFLSFFLSVRTQIKKLGLSRQRDAYTLCLDKKGLEVFDGKENAFYPWETFYGAYRRKDVVYLYVSARRAYLLPDSQAGEKAGAIWDLLMQSLPADRVFGRGG